MSSDLFQLHMEPPENIYLNMYDVQNAESEALANVRRNFFKNGFIKSKNEKFYDNVTGECLSVSYSISKGEPLKLRAKRGKNTVMRSEKLENGMYAVEIYSDNGNLKKTSIFNTYHDFFKILYFDENIKDKLVCELLFCYQNGNRVIFVNESEKEPQILYKYKAPQEVDLYELANESKASLPLKMVFSYGEEFYASKKDIELMDEHIEQMHHKKFVPSEHGFGFTPRDFSEERYNFDIESAAKHNDEETFMPNQYPAEEKTATPITNDCRESIDFAASCEKPDCVINSANEKYLYYGDIDENGDRTGIGRTMLKNGTITYYGNYLADKRSGFGTYFYKSGKPCFFGNWKENKRQGMGVGFRSNGDEIHAGSWHNDKPNGTGVRFDKSGAIKYIASFKDGEKDGFCISFDGSGNLILTKWKDGNQLVNKRVIDLNDI